MTNPITHLLWGYSISKNLTKKENLIILGLIMSVFLDIDNLPLPGFKHHGFIHTPFFVLLVCCIIYIYTRSTIIFSLSVINLTFHLVLDTLGTAAPVMWFYPFSTSSFALGTEISFFELIIIKLIWFLIPLSYISYQWISIGDNPIELVEYLEEKIGRNITYLLLLLFFIFISYILIVHYLLRLLQEI